MCTVSHKEAKRKRKVCLRSSSKGTLMVFGIDYFPCSLLVSSIKVNHIEKCFSLSWSHLIQQFVPSDTKEARNNSLEEKKQKKAPYFKIRIFIFATLSPSLLPPMVKDFNLRLEMIWQDQFISLNSSFEFQK